LHGSTCFHNHSSSYFVTNRFRHPEGVAVDHDGYVYVADTGNHAIRVISPDGYVQTLAGTGIPGYIDGPATLEGGAEFSFPNDIAVWRDWAWWPYPNPIDPDSYLYRNGNGTVNLFVVDSGNHRIRKIIGEVEYDAENGKNTWSNVRVECFSGRCKGEPEPGYGDGSMEDSRFDSPQGIAVANDGRIFVADTNNHLIREIDRFGTVKTIAGSLRQAETKRNGNEVEGCPQPCLAGIPGDAGGDSDKSTLTYPSDLAIEPGDYSLLVTDRHRIRRIDLISNLVTTLVGGEDEGERDGVGSESTLNNPASITVTRDGIAYIADSASCRIRRVASSLYSVPEVSCGDTLSTIFRPNGCSSYDDPIDEYGLTVTPVQGNIYYNFLHREQYDDDLGNDFIGRSKKNCVGSPPLSTLDKKFWNDIISEYPFNYNLVIDDGKTLVREDPNDGSRVTIMCPAECYRVLKKIPAFLTDIDGVGEVNLYPENVAVCDAAAFEGHLEGRDEVNLFDVTIVSEASLKSSGRWTLDTNSTIVPRQFFFISRSSHEVRVQTISGAPSRLLGDPCGYHDAFSPQSSSVSPCLKGK